MSEEVQPAQAFHDPLTTLPNRALFLQRLKQALARSGRTGKPVAVLFIDLDNLKEVNDTLGHAAGDHLLILIAAVLQSSLRSSDTPARLGGDEFTVLLEDLQNPAEAAVITERLLAQLTVPYAFGEREVQVGASIGVAVSTSPLDAPDELLQQADAAMYRAKRAGKGRFAIFDQRLNDEIQARREAVRELRQALARDQLRLDFQPLVRLADDAVIAVEALVRWDRPGHGVLGPADLLSLAEESSLIDALGRWVLREACRQARRWREANPRLVMAINLSRREFYHAGLPQEIAAALWESGLAPGSLALEIPERVVMRDPDRAGVVLERLSGLGVRLVLDSFGESCASLRHLRRWPLSFVKVDAGLVRGVIDSQECATLVATLINVAHALERRVLAEGVEIAAQATWLRERGCDLAQGDYFARPADGRMIGLLFREVSPDSAVTE